MEQIPDYTIREAMLEHEIDKLQRELSYLRSAVYDTSFVSAPPDTEDINVSPVIFKERILRMAAGVNASIDYGKLSVRAWTKDPFDQNGNLKIEVGYFVDPLVKLTVDDSALELSVMHTKLCRHIATEFQKRYSKTEAKYGGK